MYIMGIHAGHDATVVIIDENGSILSAVAEERLSRIKNYTGFPYRALEGCLRIANLGPEDINAVSMGFRSFLYKGRTFLNDALLRCDGGDVDLSNRNYREGTLQILWEAVLRNCKALVGKKEEDDGILYTEQAFRALLDDLGFGHAKLMTIGHHLAHAASAYYTADNCEDCLVVTIDGSGDGLCVSVSLGDEGALQRIGSVSKECSPGRFYSAITKFLGFKRNRHEGKITGLAAYGDPEICYDKMVPCLALSPDKKAFVHHLSYDLAAVQKTKTLFRILRNQFFLDEYTNHLLDYFHRELKAFSPADIAAAAQKRLEDCVVPYIETYVHQTGKSTVLLAGGVFANVKLNQRIAELPQVNSVYIHPNMGDGGVALGAAFVALYRLTNGSTPCPAKLENVYFGPGFSNEEIKKALDRFGLPADYDENIERTVAELIADGKIVGRFAGRMEYGPRALGNRTILASPTDRTINDWLNRRLKRTEFMPFAPSVLDTGAAMIFKNYRGAEYPASFMTITFDVYPEWQERAPAVSHVDGTARPQVVSEAQNPSYYRILREYERLTSLPLFVNTSFNMHEEPIVCTPEDAIRSLLNGCVDVLAIGDFIVRSSV